MKSKDYDVVILTQKEYLAPEIIDDYVTNVLKEDELLIAAFESLGLRTCRKSWDDLDFDWSSTRRVLFRATWDYFHRFEEFMIWLSKVEKLTKSINPFSLIRWNLHKFYLNELSRKGVSVPPALYLKKGSNHTLQSLIESSTWRDFVLKPAVSGGGRHTYKLGRQNYKETEQVFQSLLSEEDMLLQEYQSSITEKGECSLMVFGGKFSHAIIKRAKTGEFKVQDDFGGSVHHYEPSKEEIRLAEMIISKCPIPPIYARVDLFWGKNNEVLLAEIELIEPELWFRFCPTAADMLAQGIAAEIKG